MVYSFGSGVVVTITDRDYSFILSTSPANQNLKHLPAKLLQFVITSVGWEINTVKTACVRVCVCVCECE